MFLHGWYQRLDQEHVPFPAVGLQLHLQTVVGETVELTPGSTGCRGTAQISAASSGWALPLKTVMSRTMLPAGLGGPDDGVHGSGWSRAREQAAGPSAPTAAPAGAGRGGRAPRARVRRTTGLVAVLILTDRVSGLLRSPLVSVRRRAAPAGGPARRFPDSALPRALRSGRGRSTLRRAPHWPATHRPAVRTSLTRAATGCQSGDRSASAVTGLVRRHPRSAG